MTITKGEERHLTRWGEFRFRIGGEKYVFQVHKSNSDKERLFNTFKGATSGKGAYGGGMPFPEGWHKAYAHGEGEKRNHRD